MRLGACCENCWDFVPKLLQQAYSMLLMVCGEMGIPQSHTNVLMSEQFLYCWQIDSSHHQATRKGMPQIVEGEIGYPSLLHGCLECRAEGLVRRAVAIEKHRAIDCGIHSNGLQGCGQHEGPELGATVR